MVLGDQSLVATLLESFKFGERAVDAKAVVSAGGFVLRLREAVVPFGVQVPVARCPLRLVLRVQQPVGISLRGCKWPFWSMARNLSPIDRDMSLPLRWLARRLCDVEQPGPTRTEILLSGRRFLNELVAHAAAVCEPAARRMALKFRPSVRLRIYDRIINDSTGRVAQLAECCPGALLFALALRSETALDLCAAGDRLLADVVAGHPIDRALDRAIDVWASSSCTERRLSQARWLGAWRRLGSATAAERQRLVVQQRVLVRRAGRLVNPFLLLLPPPIVCVPEDIPQASRANARWYALLKDRAFLGSPGGDGDRHVIGLCRLLSRVAPLAQTDNRVHPGTLVGRLLDFLRAANRVPARSSSLPRLIDDARLWHRAPIDPDAAVVAAEGAFPATPMPEWSSTSVHVTALGDPAALAAEGEAMRHCVGSYASVVRSGAAFLYSARIGGKRLTLHVQHGIDGRFDLVEIAGRENRRATMAERSALRPWLAELNRQAAHGGVFAAAIDGEIGDG